MINNHGSSNGQLKHKKPEDEAVDEVQSSAEKTHLDGDVEANQEGDRDGRKNKKEEEHCHYSFSWSLGVEDQKMSEGILSK